ncbi:hypothetical protein CFP65_1742 [Kitasatospora sp. MMS16-BH015]|uniref:hypothetical protein n=1 Tax=Kitasatospora sp. MMS16-BH015 TaxID=2018025 RepID=UPI000CA332CE|nr:hypothetical protein [Kitasatospora sp. MMS16-BH015]AUG76621.1 hypothetical protein CFP65_1742 [Kitasatospora sp. MMS16-BH015]
MPRLIHRAAARLTATALAITAATTALAACESRTATEPEAVPVRTGAAGAVPPLQRAAEVARAWDGSADRRAWLSGYYPLSTQLQWEPSEGFHSGDDKFAFYASKLELHTALPPAAPNATTTVTWADGTHLALPELTADQVFRSLSEGRPDCRNHCHPLAVTAVRPGTRQVDTSRGQATVPVWEFTLAGYTQPFAYPAVTPQQTTVQVPPTTPYPVIRDATDALWSGTSPDGRTIHAQVIVHCAALDSAEAYETATAVVLIAHLHSTLETHRPPAVACAGGSLAPVDIRLQRPLDTRAVLDLVSGAPTLPLKPGQTPAIPV